MQEVQILPQIENVEGNPITDIKINRFCYEYQFEYQFGPKRIYPYQRRGLKPAAQSIE